MVSHMAFKRLIHYLVAWDPRTSLPFAYTRGAGVGWCPKGMLRCCCHRKGKGDGEAKPTASAPENIIRTENRFNSRVAELKGNQVSGAVAG